MKTGQKLLYVAGLAVFVVAVGVALHRQPLVLARLDPGLIVVGVLLATAATLLQAVHTYVLLDGRAPHRRALLATWLTAERAWLNSALPAKAGTIVAVGLLIGRLGIPFAALARFTLLSSGVTALVSLSGTGALLAPTGWAKAIAIASLALAFPAARVVHRTRGGGVALMLGSSLLGLLAISAGIATCIAGLGHPMPAAADALAIGLLLNVLSLVSITPGNFGVREIALALFAPLLAVDVAVILQGSACYVVLRLAASALIALVLRGPAMAAMSAPGAAASPRPDDGSR